MKKRKFGSTSEEVSILGFGGFHLVETPEKEAEELLNTYLDTGGNYVETAAAYGDGLSERKVGKVMKTRREECFLVTKIIDRDRASAARQIDESLRRLQTDHVDLLIYHSVQTFEDLAAIFSPGGAAEAFEEAKAAGKTRYIGISAHGIPETLIEAVQGNPVDAVMTGFNFYDYHNFPDAQNVLIPSARSKGIGIIGMKAFADGLLWEYIGDALRFSLSLDIDTMVVGCNRMDQLQKDLDIVRDFTPLSDGEMKELVMTHPFLGNYVCRFCGKCLPCPEKIDITGIFRYEGWYDRQIRDFTVRPAPEAALRDRLRFWFGYHDYARELYAKESSNAGGCTDCGECLPRCPYGIDIPGKLKNAHYKLTSESIIRMPI